MGWITKKKSWNTIEIFFSLKNKVKNRLNAFVRYGSTSGTSLSALYTSLPITHFLILPANYDVKNNCKKLAKLSFCSHSQKYLLCSISLSLFTPIFSPSIRFPSLKLLLIWSALTQFLYQKQFVFRRTPFLRLRYLNSLLYKEFTVFFHKIQKKIIKYL